MSENRKIVPDTRKLELNWVRLSVTF